MEVLKVKVKITCPMCSTDGAYYAFSEATYIFEEAVTAFYTACIKAEVSTALARKFHDFLSENHFNHCPLCEGTRVTEAWVDPSEFAQPEEEK